VGVGVDHRDAMMIMMRTTLNIPDDVYHVAKSLAAQRHVSVGEALAELVRRSLQGVPAIDANRDFPRFVMSENAEPITMQHTLELEDEW
jgi:hypothetical protein